jgi:hypothetical protein
MAVGHTYSFDSARTDHSTLFLDENNDKVAYLAAPVFPPVGTIVTVSDGGEATVTGVRLDLSNSSTLAMVYVSVKRSESN